MKIVRKLILSIMACLSVVICFGVTTYAWFAVNSEANVKGFDFEVTGGHGFMMSVDGVHFNSEISSDKMKMAIFMGNDPDEYKFSDDGDKLLDSSGDIVSMDEINKFLGFTKDKTADKLLLSPVTSKNGYEFTNLSGSSVKKSSNKFIEFDLYFQTTANDKNHNVTYDIYLSDSERTQVDGTVAPATKVESVPQEIDLNAEMTYLDNDYNLINKQDKETITVCTSNALRISAQETPIEEVKGDKPQKVKPAIIYEITNEYDKGSYATDYNKQTDQEERRLYDSTVNAMFTYYNNLRPYSKLDDYLMSFEDKPKTVRKLTDIDKEGNVIRHEENPVIVNLDARPESESELSRKPKKITFRMWLEGWDADCFDGLSNSISVRLVFNSVSKLIEEQSEEKKGNL